MLSVKGLTWGTPEFIRIAKLGEEQFERLSACDCEDEDDL